jgi:DNA repair protein RecO
MRNITGIVIQINDYQDSHVIMNILTSCGIETVLARGVKKITSKNKNLVQLYALVDILIEDKRNKILINGKVIKFPEIVFTSMLTSFTYSLLGNYINSNFDNHLDFEKAYNLFFDLLQISVNRTTLVRIIFELFALSGNKIDTNKCLCGENDTFVGFSLDMSSFLCYLCMANKSLLSQEDTNELLKILSNDIHDLASQSIYLNSIEFISVLLKKLEEEAGIYIKNKNMLAYL